MRRSLFAFAPLAASLLTFVSTSRAETYVVEPAFGRPVMGFDVYGGGPIAQAEQGTSAVAGGGSEVFYGYAWEGGWSLHGVFGGARWSSKSAFGDAIGDRDATLSEGYGGLAVRYAFLDAALAPYLQASFVSGLLRVRGPVTSSDAFGGGVGGEIGVRWRDAPWDGWIAVDARTSRFDGGIALSRAAIVVGVFVDLR